MYFAIASAIIAIACSAITIKTLVGYSDIRRRYKIIIGILVVLAWFAPLLAGGLRCLNMESAVYSSAAHILYIMFGAAFILFAMLLFRDVVWFALYGLYRKLFGENWKLHPKNINLLDKANLLVVLLTGVFVAIAIHGGAKEPELKKLEFASSRISKDMRIVMISDTHINRTTPVEKVKRLVERVNALEPDAIVLVGDIADDKVETVSEHMDALGKLKAKYPPLYTFGNHEFYNGLIPWQFKFKTMGFLIMFNHGVRIPDHNVYIAGIPDAHIANNSDVWNVNFIQAFKGAKKGSYRILLSHTPDFVDYLNKDSVDLQLSGHTHGGQIFPFHVLVKYANKYLSGLYDVNGIKLYVSNGAGYWGPAMRLFAPSEITLIELKAKP